MAALRRQGHETILIGPPGLMDARFGGGSRLVARVKRLVPSALYELLELAYNIPAYRRLSRAVRIHRPDVVYERYSLFLLAGVWMRRRTKLPLLLEVNSPLFEERSRHDGLRLHRLGRLAQGWLWRGADRVLPVTQVLGRMIEEYGVPRSRITVIPNGIDPERHRPRAVRRPARSASGQCPSRPAAAAGAGLHRLRADHAPARCSVERLYPTGRAGSVG